MLNSQRLKKHPRAASINWAAQKRNEALNTSGLEALDRATAHASKGGRSVPVDAEDEGSGQRGRGRAGLAAVLAWGGWALTHCSSRNEMKQGHGAR